MATNNKAEKPTWSEILGSNNWEGLLDPLDHSLRQHIIRCGNFCQATTDAFNNDTNSKYAGSSRYGKTSFFQKVNLQSASDYQVEGFLYATARVRSIQQGLLLHSLSPDSWDSESNWMGYVAVTTDEASRALGRREIYVVWRGTKRLIEWRNNLEAMPVSVEPLLKKTEDQEKATRGITNGIINGIIESLSEAKVMDGWLTIYIDNNPNSPFTKLSARQQVQKKLLELINKYRGEDLSIIFTGHSLGATLATLSAFDTVANGVSDIPVSAIVFGSPKVGNQNFNETIKGFENLKILSVKNVKDLIPNYPVLLGYVGSGIEFVVDSSKSPYLKADSLDLFDWHNLEGLLHVVAGWGGKDGEFDLKVKRSLALVNKSGGFLKDELLVPESWWIEKNKGMVFDDETEDWALDPPFDLQDVPLPEY